MSGPVNKPVPNARAAAVLDVPLDAGAAVARAAFLRRVVADRFAPPEECVAAANALAGAALPLSPDGRSDAAEQARADVEAFAAAYWSLPPAERRARWAGLSALAGEAVARHRLAHLEAGLDVSAVPHDNPLVEEIAAAVRTLCVLGPRERAVRRAEWLSERADRMRDLADAARRLRADAPALTRLEPELARRLADGVPLAAVPGVNPGTAAVENAARAAREARRIREQVARTQSAASADDGWGVGRVALIGLFILSAVFRAAFSSSGSHDPVPSHKPSPFIVPSYRPPTYTPAAGNMPPAPPFLSADTDVGLLFTPEEVEAIRKYEQNPTGPAPPRYLLYRTIGGKAKYEFKRGKLVRIEADGQPRPGTASTRRR